MILPWFVFFVLSIAGLVTVGLVLHTEPQNHLPSLYAMAAGVVVCLLFNISTLGKAGIWMAYSLPFQLRKSSRPWIMRAILALATASAFYFVSHAPWMPMIWQGAVVPAVFTLALFVALWHVLGPLLRWGSSMPFGRSLVFVLSLPLLASVPITAVFLGQNIFDAYQASQPDFLVISPDELIPQPVPPVEVSETPSPTEAPTNPQALELKALAESTGSCSEGSRLIQRGLDPSNSEEVAFWAIKALRCAEMRSVVALPRLVSLMQSHRSQLIRAEAISAMPLYGNEGLKQVSYLLIRRLSAQEPQAVIEAAATVMARLTDEDQRGAAIRRLTSLLDNPETGEVASNMLSQKYRRPEVVTEYVVENLNESSERKWQAVSMVCALEPSGRAIATERVSDIVKLVKTGLEDDPAIKALGCLGTPGTEAIRLEVASPQRLDPVVAAQAFASLEPKGSPQYLETAAQCARHKNEKIRALCSESLGRIGGAALPEIMELLESRDQRLKATGKNALEHFVDLDAKDELMKIREENSGWLANQRKIQLARAIDTALVKLEKKEAERLNSAPADSKSE